MSWDIPVADNCIYTSVYNVLSDGRYEWDTANKVIRVYDEELYKRALSAFPTQTEPKRVDPPKSTPNKARQRKLF